MSVFIGPDTDLDHATGPASDVATPLVERLRQLLDTIPLSVKRQGLQFEAIRERLKGRSRGKAHSGEIGAALMALGYERRRDWRVGGAYLTRWYPPGYGPGGQIMSHRVIRRLRFERPDLFPTYGNRSSEKLRKARREAAKELRLI